MGEHAFPFLSWVIENAFRNGRIDLGIGETHEVDYFSSIDICFCVDIHLVKEKARVGNRNYFSFSIRIDVVCPGISSEAPSRASTHNDF